MPLFDQEPEQGVPYGESQFRVKPTIGDYLKANFNYGRDMAIGTMAMDALSDQDWWDSPGNLSMPGKEAASHYGLRDIDPDRNYSPTSIAELIRRQNSRELNERIIQGYDAGFFDNILGFGASLLGTMTDPGEIALGLATEGLGVGGTVGRAGLMMRTLNRVRGGESTFMKARLANRFIRSNPKAALGILGNPALRGAIDGGLGNFAVSPVTQFLAETTGRRYDISDLTMDTAAGIGLGGTIGIAGAGLKHFLRRSSTYLDDVKNKANIGESTDMAAKIAAMNQIMNGESVDVSSIIGREKDKAAPEVTKAIQELSASENPSDVSLDTSETVKKFMSDHQVKIIQAIEKDDISGLGSENFIGSLRDIMQTIPGIISDAVTAAKEGNMDIVQGHVTALKDVHNAVSPFLPAKRIAQLDKLIDTVNNPDKILKSNSNLSRRLESITKGFDEADSRDAKVEFLTQKAEAARKEFQKAVGVLKTSTNEKTIAKWEKVKLEAEGERNRINLLLESVKADTVSRTWEELRDDGIDVDTLLGLDPELKDMNPNQAYKKLKDQMVSKMADVQRYRTQADPVTQRPLETATNKLAKEFQAAAEKDVNVDPETFLNERVDEINARLDDLRKFSKFSRSFENTLKKIEDEFNNDKLKIDGLQKASAIAKGCVLLEGAVE